MIRKYLLTILAVAIVGAAAAVTNVAQVGELRGHVFIQQADGQKVPLADAVIDVFRTDVTAKYNTKPTRRVSSFLLVSLLLAPTPSPQVIQQRDRTL